MMKKSKLGFFLSIALSFSANASLERDFHALIENQLACAKVGLVVQDLKTGEIIYQNRAKENFHPASNTKLFTAAAALKKLGKDFTYKTTLSQKGDSIYLRFSGDPSFSSQDLYHLLQNLNTENIKKISGNVVIDDTAFDNTVFAPGWTHESMPWYYSAPVHAIIINENKVAFQLAQTKKLGQKINITQKDKSVGSFKLTSDVKSVSVDDAENQCELTPQVKNNEFSLHGCWPAENTPSDLKMAIDNPRALAEKLIKQYLKELKIPMEGTIKFAKAPSDVKVIATHNSPPLSVMISKVLADSNNLYSESLTKTLGFVTENKGSFQAGTRAIKNILKESGQLDFKENRLSDGSGQSRYNLITPSLISDLLLSMYHSPEFTDYYSTLSVAGKTGTLSNRLKEKNLIGRVVAKTGTAIGTSALSGYFTGESGREYLFVIMINHAAKENKILRDFEDKLCMLLIKEPWLLQR